MRALWAFIAALLLAGCPHPPPGPQPPPDLRVDMAVQLPACPASMTVTPEQVCDGVFTPEGLACAACTGAAACLDQIDVIYCVAPGGCLNDPRCRRATEDGGLGAKRTLRRR